MSSQLMLYKYKILHIGSQNITVEYKLNNREIIKINEECSLRVDFDDDTFKADNYILFVEGKWNDWLNG